MRQLAALFCALVLAAASTEALACAPAATGVPAFTGRMVYEDFSTGLIYLYNFQGATTCTQPALIPTASWGLTSAENPVFSPDGQAVVFAAVQTIDGTAETNLYYWPIGAALPDNLTAQFGNTRSEDVKFSPDGLYMVWKEASGIWVANFALDTLGQPQITGQRQIVSGTLGTSTEASGPTYTLQDQNIVYFTGSAAAPPQNVQEFPAPGPGLPFPQPSGTYYYYPIVDFTLGKLFYVSGVSSRDKIFVYPNANMISPTVPAAEWNAADTGSDNSDPGPIDGDYFIFSRDNTPDGGGYELYLGQLSTGSSWSLDPLNVNIAGGSMRGAAYTSSQLTPSAWDSGGANYRPGIPTNPGSDGVGAWP